ncbi:MAG: RNA polymerase subunit sigma-24 [Crocinitomicaceae bacterium]|jgi:RNA polymerase sigma-70 factor (ECF subfamily)|nr:RNA polymerase subunit sigma-24 [Crocinitomicaceae bacterium]MEC9159330.1 sigma-70 family RNA polymerase sigma factor [Bacteroidota bacterium]|tara:strand:+ start:885 stop:1502 length:618 start_codon:yes stop_codon:yes gene_type:complete
MDHKKESTHLSEKAQKDYDLVIKATKYDDQQAFSDLMDRYKDSIYFMLLKMVNNKDDAEDLTIEAFGKAFNSLKQYTPNYAFSTWLFKIATNNCIDFLRKKKKKTMSIDNSIENKDGDEITIELKSDARTPEQETIRDQKIELMRSYVKKLKPRYETLVEMRYFKEMSYEEISNELNLPLGTVKAQLFRAREFLYNLMKHNIETI